MQKVILSEYNICLLSFSHVLHEYECNILNDLHSYSLLKQSKLTKDIKKFLTHHIIYCICNALVFAKSKEKKVFYYFPEHDLQLYSHFNKEQLNEIVEKILKKVSKMLPFCVYYGETSFSYFCSNITSFKGDGYESLLKLLASVNTFNIETFRFNKIKTFAKRNELTFLNQDFFNSFIIKQHLLV